MAGVSFWIHCFHRGSFQSNRRSSSTNPAKRPALHSKWSEGADAELNLADLWYVGNVSGQFAVAQVPRIGSLMGIASPTLPNGQARVAGFCMTIGRCINNRNISAVMLLSSHETTGESGRVGEATTASGAAA